MIDESKYRILERIINRSKRKILFRKFVLSVRLNIRRLVCSLVGHSAAMMEDFDTVIMTSSIMIPGSAVLSRCKRCYRPLGFSYQSWAYIMIGTMKKTVDSYLKYRAIQMTLPIRLRGKYENC